jgi:hypothetical protein
VATFIFFALTNLFFADILIDKLAPMREEAICTVFFHTQAVRLNPGMFAGDLASASEHPLVFLCPST